MEETERDQEVRGQIQELVTLFPQVRPEEVPQEVWDQVRDGRSLALAYCLYRLGRTEEELRQLKGKLLSPGSVSSAGNSGGEGTLAAFWDAYQI